jgi:hypothetical protein
METMSWTNHYCWLVWALAMGACSGLAAADDATEGAAEQFKK